MCIDDAYDDAWNNLEQCKKVPKEPIREMVKRANADSFNAKGNNLQSLHYSRGLT